MISKQTKAGLLEALKMLAIVVGIVVLLSLFGCAVWRDNPTQVRVFAGWDIRESPAGREPTGNVLFSQPLPLYMEANYLHISSIPDAHDAGLTDQFGIGFCVKIPYRRCN
ncbi:MAG: hypothetical protein RL254_1229 [Planctomycetota bacterium]|jgi:hypothetical protein